MAATQVVSRPKARTVGKPPGSEPGQTQVLLQRGVSPSLESNLSHFANYRELVDRVVGVFGDEIKASRWLSIPNRELKGKTPIEVAQANGYTLAFLEPILIRIEHGIDYDSGAA